MLIVRAWNDGTGENGLGNYDCVVSVNGQEIARIRVEGHVRDMGWQTLLRLIADKQSAVQP